MKEFPAGHTSESIDPEKGRTVLVKNTGQQDNLWHLEYCSGRLTLGSQMNHGNHSFGQW